MKHLWLLLAFLALPAYATDLTLNWTAPTKNTDGTPITGVLSYNIYGGACGSMLALLTSGITTTTNVRANVNPGNWGYAVSAVVASQESAQTAPVCTTVAAPLPVPGSPGGLTVTLATTSTIAYMMPTGENTFAPLIVGSAPLATSCDATHSVQAAGVAYYVIPWTAVTYSGALKPHTVYANCS